MQPHPDVGLTILLLTIVAFILTGIALSMRFLGPDDEAALPQPLPLHDHHSETPFE